MDAICIWLFCGEIQSIKNGLDPGPVKAVAILHLSIQLCGTAIQNEKTIPHILDMPSVILGYRGGDHPAVETEFQCRSIVFSSTGEQRTEKHQQYDDRGKNSHYDPTDSFPGLFTAQNCRRCFCQHRQSCRISQGSFLPSLDPGLVSVRDPAAPSTQTIPPLLQRGAHTR